MTNKLTILQVTDAYFPNINGVSFAVDAFSKNLAKDFKIKIIAPAFRLGNGREAQGEVEIERFISIPFPLYKGTHLANPNVQKFFKLVKETNPSIIHFHTVGPLGSMAILAAKRFKIPLIGTYHTVFPETLMYLNPTKRLKRYWELVEDLSGFHTPSVDPDFSMPIKPTDLPKEAVWGMVNKYYSFADVVICPSNAIERELQKRHFTKPTVVISNGLDIKEFSVKKNKKVSNTLLFVGRLGYEKHVDIVIKATAEVKKTNPQIKLVIAGDGPAGKDLKRLARRLKLENSIEFLGMIKRDELPKIYANADLFVTAGMETQGLVVLEAFASGLPVVATNRYALGDLVKSGVNGYLVEPGDHIGMSNSIKRILSNQELLVKLQKGARLTAQEHDIAKSIKKTIKLYDSLERRDRKD